MNNKNKAVTDKSAPYRTLGINKITAPVKTKADPGARVIKGEKDLRVGGKKA